MSAAGVPGGGAVGYSQPNGTNLHCALHPGRVRRGPPGGVSRPLVGRVDGRALAAGRALHRALVVPALLARLHARSWARLWPGTGPARSCARGAAWASASRPRTRCTSGPSSPTSGWPARSEPDRARARRRGVPDDVRDGGDFERRRRPPARPSLEAAPCRWRLVAVARLRADLRGSHRRRAHGARAAGRAGVRGGRGAHRRPACPPGSGQRSRLGSECSQSDGARRVGGHAPPGFARRCLAARRAQRDLLTGGAA